MTPKDDSAVRQIPRHVLERVGIVPHLIDDDTVEVMCSWDPEDDENKVVEVQKIIARYLPHVGRFILSPLNPKYDIEGLGPHLDLLYNPSAAVHIPIPSCVFCGGETILILDGRNNTRDHVCENCMSSLRSRPDAGTQVCYYCQKEKPCVRIVEVTRCLDCIEMLIEARRAPNRT